MFEMIDRDGLARVCKLEARGKGIETPILLPVVNPNIGPISPFRMKEEFGVTGIITNSYIISRDEELRDRALKEGIHELLGFDGLVMTDSGTFQEHVYGDVEVDPLEIVGFQREIGSNIGTILDIFSEPDFSEEEAKRAVDETVRRASESVKIRDDMWLAGPVQGSLFGELRERCAKELSTLDMQLHPIGGVVPLMEGYRFPELVDVIIASKKGLVPSRPVHLFGAGHPMLFPLAVLLGCDVFDSASYAKFARDGRMMFLDGTETIDELSELWCQCPICSSHTLKELHEMDDRDRERAIAGHNLWTCQEQILRIKDAIRNGTLWELVERTCRAHPRLLDGLRRLKEHNDFIERYEPLSRKGALLFTGEESYARPAIFRYQRRVFERYSHPDAELMVGLPEGPKPYGRTYARIIREITERANAHFIVLSSIGPVPIELDEIYPVTHFYAPESDRGELRPEIRNLMERYSHEQRYSMTLLWEGEETLKFIEMMMPQSKRGFDIDLARVTALLKMQFGRGANNALNDETISFIKSKSTGRIRNILVNDEHAFSIRARDGYISLTNEGARLIHSVLKRPGYRVRIVSDAIPFVEKGSNVFAKFVNECDPEIRPNDQVLIVDEDDRLLGHGRSLMNREEMLSFERGVAVKTRGGMAEEEDDKEE